MEKKNKTMSAKRFLTTIAALTVALTVAWAQGPNNSGTYYKNADGKKGQALKTAMYGIIYNRTEVSYKNIWTAFKTTDLRSDGKIWDMYSGTSNFTYETDQAGNYKVEGDKYNREHSFPKSWFGGEESSVPGHDLFHIYPTDGFVNGQRSNHPFGETNGEKYKSNNNFSKLGACTYSGYTGIVFEPNDMYKGDFARTYFYMVTCYEEQIPTWYSSYSAKNEGCKATLDGKTYPGLSTWQLKMLREWAKKDQVSAKETARNKAVYSLQKNRNPFIDYPGLEEYIWGDWQDVAFSYDNYVNPYSGETPVQTIATPVLSPVSGTTFTGTLNVTITCSTSGATIYYTTDGTDPNKSSTKYSSSITLTATTTIKAVAYDNEGNSSSVASATYTLSNSGGTPVAGEYTATFNFPEKSYGMKALSGSTSEYNPNPTTITSDNVTLTMAGNNSSRYWSTSGTYELRVYKACTMTIAAPENGKITKIVFAGTTVTGIQCNNKTLTNSTWTGEAESVSFTFTATQRINTITVTYEVEGEEQPLLLGDVDKSGEVTIADVKALVSILLGKDASEELYDHKAADVNADGKVTIADVTALVNLLLGKIF